MGVADAPVDGQELAQDTSGHQEDEEVLVNNDGDHEHGDLEGLSVFGGFLLPVEVG